MSVGAPVAKPAAGAVDAPPTAAPLRRLVYGCLITGAVATAAQAVMILLPPFPAGLPTHSSMLAVHLLLELFAVVIAVLIVTVSWHTFSARDGAPAQLLITGFTAVAVCDVVHALTYAGMPPLLGEASTQRAIFFWLMGRAIEVGTLGLIALGVQVRGSRNAALAAGVALAALLVWIGSARLHWFPVSFVPGEGVTPFKAAFEVVLCAVSLAVAVVLWRRARRDGLRRHYILATSAWVIGIGELSFTTYVAPSDFHNIFGHSYKIVGYALLYWATFIVSLRAPYEALRASQAQASEGEARLRTLSDNLPGSMMFQYLRRPDDSRCFTYVSHSVFALTGLTPQQALDDPDALGRRWHPDDQPGVVEVREQSLRTLEDFQHEGRLRHLDGTERTVQVRARPRRLADGTVAWDGVVTDVTEARRAEAARRENAAMLAAVIHSASDAVISTDLEGRISLFNPAAERIFGHPAQAMLGQPLDRLLPAGARAHHLHEVQRFAQAGASTRAMGAGRVPGVRADGSALELEASISQVVVNGRTVLTAILRDVTERVRTERALVQYQLELTELTHRLMAQEKETSRRLAQVLHDQLGQTLTAIRLHFVDDAVLADPRQAARHARVDALIDQAIREVRQVLVELRPTVLDEQGLVAALDNELRSRQAEAGAVQLRLDVDAATAAQRWEPDVEYAAFMVAREAIANALSHAAAGCVELLLRGDGQQLHLSVVDDGRGLAGDALQLRPGHLGLVGMRERALAIGARFELRPGPAGGTIASLDWEAQHR